MIVDLSYVKVISLQIYVSLVLQILGQESKHLKVVTLSSFMFRLLNENKAEIKSLM